MAVALSRRQFLRASAASGALLVARPIRSLADDEPGSARRSKLDPTLGDLLHADLHNHSLLSDGSGDPEAAFASMAAAGLDVAALTDHSGVNKLAGDPTRPLADDACDGCRKLKGIDEEEWQRLGAAADGANRDGSFVALRGFEWSSPTLGHMNVWFSETWTDPLACGAIGASATASSLMHEYQMQDDVPVPLDPAVEAEVNALLRTAPEGEASMALFYEWLATEGSDGVAGFNHPGREAGRFGYFAFDGVIAERVVSLELFNRNEDYLFEGVPGARSPLVECLDAGWKVGIAGVTDEHGTNWGIPLDKGRTGLWLPAGAGRDRAGVRAAMQSRRFFATRERGLRVDAAANGVPMGSTVTHTAGVVTFALDIDRGADWVGHALRVQVLQTGTPLPTVVHEVDVVVPAPSDPPLTFSARIDIGGGDWVVLRITDPAVPADPRAAGFAPYERAGSAVAYASPFYLAAAPA